MGETGDLIRNNQLPHTNKQINSESEKMLIISIEYRMSNVNDASFFPLIYHSDTGYDSLNPSINQSIDRSINESCLN